MAAASTAGYLRNSFFHNAQLLIAYPLAPFLDDKRRERIGIDDNEATQGSEAL